MGVDVRSAGYEETALHVAAKEGHVEVVEVLLRNGARVDARSRFGWTPLIWAVACGGVDVATVLLQAGADGALWTYGVDGGKGTCAVEEARRCARPDDMARVLRKWGGV